MVIRFKKFAIWAIIPKPEGPRNNAYTFILTKPAIKLNITENDNLDEILKSLRIVG